MPSKIFSYVMKLRFVTDERKNGDIEALADVRRALKNYIPPSRQILQDCLDLVALLRLSHIHRLILHLGEAQVVNKPKSEYINT